MEISIYGIVYTNCVKSTIVGKQGLNSIFNQKTLLMLIVDLIFKAGSIPKTVIIGME